MVADLLSDLMAKCINWETQCNAREVDAFREKLFIIIVGGSFIFRSPYWLVYSSQKKKLNSPECVHQSWAMLRLGLTHIRMLLSHYYRENLIYKFRAIKFLFFFLSTVGGCVCVRWFSRDVTITIHARPCTYLTK